MPLNSNQLDDLLENIDDLGLFIAFLKKSNYTSEFILQYFGIKANSVDELLGSSGKISFFFAEEIAKMHSAISVLCRLFFLSCEVERSLFERYVPADCCETLYKYGLVTPVADNRVKSQVTIVKFVSCYLFSDNLFYNHGGGQITMEKLENVYLTMPTHASSTDLFRHTERNPDFRSLLDVGCGSGVQSICSKSAYQRIVGIDDSLRSIQFSKINAKLNGIPIDYIQADCLEFDACSEIFDHIVMNSPTYFELVSINGHPDADNPAPFHKKDLLPMFVDKKLESLLSPQGLFQGWGAWCLHKEFPIVDALLADAIPNLHKRFAVSILPLPNSPLSMSSSQILNNQIPDEEAAEIIRTYKITEVLVAIINIHLIK